MQLGIVGLGNTVARNCPVERKLVGEFPQHVERHDGKAAWFVLGVALQASRQHVEQSIIVKMYLHIFVGSQCKAGTREKSLRTGAQQHQDVPQVIVRLQTSRGRAERVGQREAEQLGHVAKDIRHRIGHVRMTSAQLLSGNPGALASFCSATVALETSREIPLV